MAYIEIPASVLPYLAWVAWMLSGGVLLTTGVVTDSILGDINIGLAMVWLGVGLGWAAYKINESVGIIGVSHD